MQPKNWTRRSVSRGLVGVCLTLALSTPGAGQAAIDKQTLAKLKAATVFISLGQKKGAPSGSGFLVHAEKGRGLIVTNAHVAERGVSDAIDVVFNSGTRRERTVSAKLVGRSRAADLAFLELRATKLPTPLKLPARMEVQETEDVLIIGFPFGKGFATNRDTPAVTISKGIVSSLRLDINDEPKLVQIDGDLNPGNSGGPIVNERGELIGVAVATVKRTNIGFAVPVARLRAGLDGMLVDLDARPRKGALRVTARKLDPMGRVESAALIVGTAREADILPLLDSRGRWRAIATRSKARDFTRAAGGLLSALHPLPSEVPEGHVIIGQIRLRSSSGVRHQAPFRIEPRSLAVALSGPDVYQIEATRSAASAGKNGDADDAKGSASESLTESDVQSVRDLLVKTGLDALIVQLAEPSDRVFGAKTTDPEEQTIRERVLDALVADWPRERVHQHYEQTFVEAGNPSAVEQVVGVMNLPAMQSMHRTLKSFDAVKESAVNAYLSELRRDRDAWDDRLALMKELDELRQFSKSASAAAGVAHATLATLVNELKPRSTRKSKPILERDIAKSVTEMTARARRRVPHFLLYMYRDATEEDLQDYMGLLRTRSLEWFASMEYAAYIGLAEQRFASAEDELIALFRDLRREVFGLAEGPDVKGMSESEAIKTIIESYGKDAVVAFLLKKRGGAITIQQRGGFRTAYGRPRKDLITERSLLQDLGELKLSPTQFVQAMDDHQVEMKFRERRLDARARRARLLAALRAHHQRRALTTRSRSVVRSSTAVDPACNRACLVSYNTCVNSVRRNVGVCLSSARAAGKSPSQATYCSERGSEQARECGARRMQCASACN